MLAVSLVALVGLASLAAPPPARADDAAQARFYFERGRAHYRARRYERALEDFFAVQSLSPSPGTLYNIARCFELLGHDESAFLYYSEYLASGDRQQRDATVEAIERLSPRIARVHVITEPPGAAIRIDDRDHGTYGRTDLVVSVEPGEREIFVDLEGYRPASARVQARRGLQVEVRFQLTRIVGSLVVRGPEATRYRLRDDASEVVAQMAVGEPVEVPPGRYTLELASTEHRAWSRVVRVEPDARMTVQASLEALPTPTGALTVTSTQRARVSIDGEPVDFTPALLPSLPAGSHRLEVTAPGMRALSRDLFVPAEEHLYMTVSLAPPPSSDVSPATWIVGGIGVLGLLAGAGITIGAVVNHDAYESQRMAYATRDELSSYADTGAALDAANVGAWVTGGLGIVVGVLLYLVTRSTTDERSRATVERRR